MISILELSYPCMILIDSGCTQNMISTNFATKLRFPLVPGKTCFVQLPNNESSVINHQMLKVLIDIQVIMRFWSGARYNVILRMTWLYWVDAHIACKEGAVCGTFSEGKPFYIKGKRLLPKIPMFSHFQIMRSIR